MVYNDYMEETMLLKEALEKFGNWDDVECTKCIKSCWKEKTEPDCDDCDYQECEEDEE